MQPIECCQHQWHWVTLKVTSLWSLSNSRTSVNVARINYSVFTWKSESTCALLFQNRTDFKFRGSQVDSKCCNISKTVQNKVNILLQTTNRKWHMAYKMAAFRSDDLERPSRSSTHCKPFQMYFFVQLYSNWQDFNWHRASRGSSAIAELLVNGQACMKLRTYAKNSVKITQCIRPCGAFIYRTEKLRIRFSFLGATPHLCIAGVKFGVEFWRQVFPVNCCIGTKRANKTCRSHKNTQN